MKKKSPVFHDPLPPFQMLLSQQCWGIAAGAGTGAMASLHFGRKLPRSRPIDNPSLDAALRTHQGEVILFIECRWSLSSKTKSYFDSETDETPKMLRALRRLQGAVVRNIDLTMPVATVSLAFDNGDRLDMRVDPPDADDPHDNFTLSLADASFIIGPDLALRIEPRKGLLSPLGRANASVARRPLPARRVAQTAK